MQIVIDIPETIYKAVVSNNLTYGIATIFRAIRNGTPLPKVHKMREATPEELESVNNYIKSISKPTGVNIWDEITEHADACNAGAEEHREAMNWLKAMKRNETKLIRKTEDGKTVRYCEKCNAKVGVYKTIKFCPMCGAEVVE